MDGSSSSNNSSNDTTAASVQLSSEITTSVAENTTTTATDSTPEGPGDLEIFDDSDDASQTRSTIKIDCEKCGHDEAVWWMLQTRSADEPTTQFYRCVKCQYTWRDYS